MITGRKSYHRLWWLVVRMFAPYFDPCMQPHEFVLRDGIQIDVGIVNLVEILWSLGIPTHNSCQGDPELERLMELAHGLGDPYQAYVTLGDPGHAFWLMERISEARTTSGLKTSLPRMARAGNSNDIIWHVSFPAALLKDGHIEDAVERGLRSAHLSQASSRRHGQPDVGRRTHETHD